MGVGKVSPLLISSQIPTVFTDSLGSKAAKQHSQRKVKEGSPGYGGKSRGDDPMVHQFSGASAHQQRNWRSKEKAVSSAEDPYLGSVPFQETKDSTCIKGTKSSCSPLRSCERPARIVEGGASIKTMEL